MIFNKQVLAIRTVLLAVFVGIVLIIVDMQNPQFIKDLRKNVHSTMSPTYSVAELIRYTKEQLGISTISKNELVLENKALKARLVQTQVAMHQLSVLAAENNQLRGMLQYPPAVNGKVAIAAVIGIDNNPLRQVLVINKGRNQGVYVGQTVVDEAGIMGQIINVYSDTSRMMLLCDRQHAISAAVDRTGSRGIIEGIGNTNLLKLSYINKKSDIKVGDVIKSTGLGNRFPKGYPLGNVSEIDTSVDGEFMEIYVKPSANLANSNFVMLMFQPKSKYQASQQLPKSITNHAGEIAPDVNADFLISSKR